MSDILSTAPPPPAERAEVFAGQVRRSFAWQGGAQLAGQLVSWAGTLLVVRLLAPEDYGLMAMVMLFLGFLFTVADLGVGAATVQARELDEEQLRHVLGVVATSAVAGMALSFMAAPLVAAFFGEPRLTPIVRVLSLNFLLMAAASLPQAQAMRRMDFRTKARIDVASSVAGTVASLALAAAGMGVWALVFAVLGQNLCRAVGYQVASPLRVWPAFSSASVAPLVKFGAVLSLDRAVFFFYGNVDAMIAGRVLGGEALGVYTVALAFAATPLQKVIPTVTQVSFAAFSRIQTDPDRVRRNVRRAFRLAAAVAAPVLFGMGAVAPVMVPLVLGERWAAVVLPFQLMCAVLPLRMLSAVLSPAVMGTGRPGVNLGNMVISLVLMGLAFSVGVRFGVAGLAASWVVMFPLVFAVTTLRAARALALPARELASAAWRPMLAAAVMAALVSAAHRALPAAVGGWTRLALLIACGAAAYAALVWALDRGLVRDLRAAALP
jgi:O-antigen/teichoic acid export membrane protein